ncbi:MraY family glycosyltransferase [Ectothiorhodospira shaposhnikovii]|uniref:MraY family glycosyltransferase n=1 Tax=Ectothiorhodospira shaposhnikovii TaxID=1054 RepID=UPI001EE955F2|nr:MraY family glycosyltransferase [Ectothiorhodospira shaposhnikovii]MCG5512759.1 undecaprenyl/decaprenyl-phosphate alpha-N-acetylglucosaminyl 1-phosphate transferase [Ectothiorhodospira shaposhnikovii]
MLLVQFFPSSEWMPMVMMLTAMIVVVVSLALSLKVGTDYFGLLDHPGAHKTHVTPTPLIGGIAVILTLLLCTLPVWAWHLSGAGEVLLLPPGVLSALLLLLVVGAVDDARPVSVRLRLVAQILAVGMMAWSGVLILDIGLFALNDVFGVWGWAVAALVTLFAVVGCINAFNMIDGMDGLAAGLGVVSLAGLAAVLFMADLGAQGMLLLILLGALAGFLLLNMRLGRPRGLVFLGDAGSTTLGFLMAYWVIVMSQSTDALIPATAALWFLGLPVIDTLRVMLKRMAAGASPFQPGHDHLHHLLQARGLGVNQTLAVMLGVQAVMVGTGIWQALFATSALVMTLLWVALIAALTVTAEWLRVGRPAIPSPATDSVRTRQVVDLSIENVKRR